MGNSTSQQGFRYEYQHGELTADGATHPFKTATLSFWDERARREWPRRMILAGRWARRALTWGIPKGQAGCGGVYPMGRVRISQSAEKNGRSVERREE
jgi:hypothetical protein